MAWQLIYTSAPRLLEAGRSGFGSVARHRAIPPLLVAALERISQFSRLPGLDAERVIYAYRVIAAGGGRFHVLSCIRDAGADYTGRTNHVAHHLIAEPREIAALGANGASPADVLLAVPWCEAWNDSPRWLEPMEEFPLSSVVSQTTADHAWWASVTGDATHAWLLARGEASRSANLLTPPGCDLRPLFAESLRLTPERLWQMPFTTALQPSDDPADFRWLGLEAGCQDVVALPAQRPTLDLSAPGTLPVPDVPAVPAPSPVAAKVSVKAVAGKPPAASNPQATSAQRPTATAPKSSPTSRSVPEQPSKPAARWPWLVAGLVGLLAAGGWFIHQRQGQQIKEARDLTYAQVDRLRPLEAAQEAKLRQAIDKLPNREWQEKGRALIVATAEQSSALSDSGEPALQELRTVLRGLAEDRAAKQAAEFAKKQATAATPTPKPATPAPAPKQPIETPPKPANSALLYLAESKESLSGLIIPELKPELNFELTVKGEVIRLGFKNGPYLRRNVQSTGDGFLINGQTLTAEPASPEPPFSLAARTATEEVFRIHVGAPEQGAALFPGGRLESENDGWKVIGDFPKPAPSAGAALLIVGTKPAGADGTPLQLPCDSQLRCSLDSVTESIRAQITALRKQADEFAQRAAQAEKGAGSIDQLRKTLQNDLQILKTDEARKVVNFSSSSAQVLVGSFGMALVTDWKNLVSEKGDQQRSDALEALYGQSRKLADATSDPERARSEMLNLRRVIISSDKILRTNPFSDGLGRLRLLNDNLAMLLGDSSLVKQAVAKNRELSEQKEREAKTLEALPLLRGILPPDTYTLVARFGSGKTIKLCPLQVSETASR